MPEGRGDVVPEDQRALTRQVAALTGRPAAVQPTAAEALRGARRCRRQMTLRLACGNPAASHVPGAEDMCN